MMMTTSRHTTFTLLCCLLLLAATACAKVRHEERGSAVEVKDLPVGGDSMAASHAEAGMPLADAASHVARRLLVGAGNSTTSPPSTTPTRKPSDRREIPGCTWRRATRGGFPIAWVNNMSTRRVIADAYCNWWKRGYAAADGWQDWGYCTSQSAITWPMGNAQGVSTCPFSSCWVFCSAPSCWWNNCRAMNWILCCKR